VVTTVVVGWLGCVVVLPAMNTPPIRRRIKRIPKDNSVRRFIPFNPLWHSMSDHQ
jgi:hypothetical protein